MKFVENAKEHLNNEIKSIFNHDFNYVYSNKYKPIELYNLLKSNNGLSTNGLIEIFNRGQYDQYVYTISQNVEDPQ